MSLTHRRNWLIAYDIADPPRLCRVHRFLKRNAIPVQYSVFVLHGNQFALERILRGISERIDTDEDDVRAYHLPDHCEVAMLGLQYLPQDVLLPVRGLEQIMRGLTDPGTMTIEPS